MGRRPGRGTSAGVGLRHGFLIQGVDYDDAVVPAVLGCGLTSLVGKGWPNRRPLVVRRL